MISKFNQYNESVLNKLEGPVEKDVLKTNPTEVLIYAYNNDNLELFRLALEHGADINKKYSNKDLKYYTLLWFSIKANKNDYSKLLIDFGASVDKIALFLGRYGSYDIIKYILEKFKFTYEEYRDVLLNCKINNKLFVVGNLIAERSTLHFLDVDGILCLKRSFCNKEIHCTGSFIIINSALHKVSSSGIGFIKNVSGEIIKTSVKSKVLGTNQIKELILH